MVKDGKLVPIRVSAVKFSDNSILGKIFDFFKLRLGIRKIVKAIAIIFDANIKALPKLIDTINYEYNYKFF